MSRLTFGFVLIGLALVTPAATAQIFNDCLSNGAPIDSGLPPVVETITVPVNETVLDVQVAVVITHTFIGDLEIDFTGPNAVTIGLHNGEGSSADDINVVYTDLGVPNGSEPYTCGCAMQPSSGVFASYSGISSQGDWTIVVDDTLGGDVGTLDTWCLTLLDVGPPPSVQNLSCTTEPGTGIIDATWTNGDSYDSIEIRVNGVLEAVLPGTATSYSSNVIPTPGPATLAVTGLLGGGASIPQSCLVNIIPAGSTGADVIYSDCQSITNWGSLGGIRAYSLGSYTCNIGDLDLDWGATSPLLGMNAFRLVDGRIEQIGMSWLKNGTVAAAGSGCGLPCNGNGGNVLGAGCLDVYGSSYNGGRGILGPRSDCNAFTGEYPGQSGTDNTVIGERLQIHEVDLQDSAALYFVEGMYVAFDDAQAGNAYNNATYKRVTVTPGSLDLNPVGSPFTSEPAILAWRDHGLGVGQPDPSVEIQTVDVPNEGRFYVGSKVTDLGGGDYRYDYAIYNINSHRSGGSLSVPTGPGVNISALDFTDVDYHSGEPFDNTDWNMVANGTEVMWSSPETYAQNPNSNALRFGTLYSFSFVADAAPETGTATMALFRPGTPDSVSFDVPVPGTPIVGPEFTRGDCNGDAQYNIADAVFALEYLFPSSPPAPPLDCEDACDSNDDGSIDIADPTYSLNQLFNNGPNPPNPFPGCGPDPTGDMLTCDVFLPCP